MLHLLVPQSQEFWNAGNQRDSKQTVSVFPSWFFLLFSFLFGALLKIGKVESWVKTRLTSIPAGELLVYSGGDLWRQMTWFTPDQSAKKAVLRRGKQTRVFLGRLRFARDHAIWLHEFRPKEGATQKRFRLVLTYTRLGKIPHLSDLRFPLLMLNLWTWNLLVFFKFLLGKLNLYLLFSLCSIWRMWCIILFYFTKFS